MCRLLTIVLALTACTSPPPADVPDAAVVPDAAPPLEDAYAPPPPRVTIPDGTIVGSNRVGVREFLGIPYAAPPVGPLRFRPPQPVVPWTTPRTSARPNACPQNLEGIAYGNEDCLYLNVHTPDPMPTGAPVMIWIHGGAFVLGEGVQADRGTYGDLLARDHGVIVVSMNYRLGQLGFLAHASLDTESSDHVSGNYGFLDQVAAIQWVHDHIAAFGGDPGNVTVFGESAGGMSVCGHLTSSLSHGLFQRAIIESGPCGLPMPTNDEAEAQGTRVGAMLGCTGDVPTCLRAASATTLVNTLGASPAIVSNDPMYGSWGPSVDGHVFTQDWMASIRAGDAADVPIQIGWNQDEGRLFVALAQMAGSPAITEANYRATIVALIGEAHADEVLARYPSSMFGGDARFAAARAMGDAALACPTRAAAVALREAGNSVHTYFFSYPDAHFLLSEPFSLGAFHSAEIQFVFGHPMGGAFTADETTLYGAMSAYWTRFASNDGDPNASGSPTWPAYDASGARVILDRTITAGVDDYQDVCAFWAGIPISQ